MPLMFPNLPVNVAPPESVAVTFAPASMVAESAIELNPAISGSIPKFRKLPEVKPLKLSVSVFVRAVGPVEVTVTPGLAAPIVNGNPFLDGLKFKLAADTSIVRLIKV